MRCSSRNCDCNKPWKRGRSGAIGAAYRERKVDGQRETLTRLIRSVPEATIRSEVNGTTWITVDGFTAPVIVEHGFVTVRTKFEDRIGRTKIDLPKRAFPLLGKYVAKVVKEAHTNFAMWTDRQTQISRFEGILRDQRVRLRGLTQNGLAVVEMSLTLTIEQAEKLAGFLKEMAT